MDLKIILAGLFAYCVGVAGDLYANHSQWNVYLLLASIGSAIALWGALRKEEKP